MTDCAAFLFRKHGARALWFSGGVWQNTTGQPERLLSVEGTQKRLQPSSFPSFCSLIIFWKMKKGWVQFKLTIEKKLAHFVCLISCTKNGEYYDLNAPYYLNEGWPTQPHLAQPDWTLGQVRLHTCCTSSRVHRLTRPSSHTHRALF